MASAIVRLARLVREDTQRARVEADRILSRDAKSRKVRAARSRPRREAKAETRKARNERMGAIRAEVMSGVQFCAMPGCSAAPQHAHHLISGNGNRRTHEAADTLAPLCEGHHRLIHAGSLTYLLLLAQWASRHASEEAQIALERRIRKAHDAQWRGA